MTSLAPPTEPLPAARVFHPLAWGIGAVAAVALAAAGGAAALYRVNADEVRADRARELAALVQMKADAVARWKTERLADALALARDPAIAAAVQGGRQAVVREELEEWFGALRRVGDYEAVALLGPDGGVAFAFGQLARDLDDRRLPELAARVMARGEPALADLHGDGPEDPPHLNLVTPLLGSGRVARGAVLLRIDPTVQLFPSVQAWPAATRTGEVFLARVEDGGLRVLSPLRRGGHPPLSLLLPLPAPPSGDARAAALARDDRGIEVLSAAQRVDDSGWQVIAQLDADEAFAPVRERLRWTMAVAVALVLLAAALAALAWRAQASADATRRYRELEERSALAHRLERLTNWAHDLVFLTDADHRIVEVNDRAVEALGYGREELLAMRVPDLRDPATLGDFEARVREQLAGSATIFETRYRRKDGSTFPVEVSVHAEEVDGRRFHHGIVRDITDRKKALEALQASEAKFRTAFENASLGTVMADGDERILECNAAFRRMLGRPGEALRGRLVRELVHPDDDAVMRPVMAALREGRLDVHEGHRRYLRPDGTAVEAVARVSAIRGASGEFLYSIALVDDVTEKRRLEAQLHLTDRLASLGTLAAGVAHEINNPLAFVLANLEFSLRELQGHGADGEVLAALDEAREGAARVREIVRDLKTFSRADDGLKENVDLRRVLKSALALAAHELRHRARLEVSLGAPPPVLASEHRLGQVALNLLVNAAQAIPEGQEGEHLIRASTGTAPDGRALLEVADTGAGIAPELLPRIFDPFFTTKPVGVGTGLGLSICHGIVTAMGGDIEVESSPGCGSLFRVLLPPAAAREVAEAPPRNGTGAPARRARVLVVDDEPFVIRAVQRVLSPPHEVIGRETAQSALDLLVAPPDRPFDLVLCDLMMPEMTGMQLHAAVRAAAPAVADRFVFLSGGAFTTGGRDFLEHVPNACMEKPFDPRALKDLVERLLADAAR